MSASPSPLQIPLINGVRHSFASHLFDRQRNSDRVGRGRQIEGEDTDTGTSSRPDLTSHLVGHIVKLPNGR